MFLPALGLASTALGLLIPPWILLDLPVPALMVPMGHEDPSLSSLGCHCGLRAGHLGNTSVVRPVRVSSQRVMPEILQGAEVWLVPSVG